MNNLRNPRGFAGYLTKVLCLILSLGMVLMGFPIRDSVAQDDVLTEGTTPQLLREQERVLSEEQCGDLLKRINFLRDPTYERKIRESKESLERMVKQAEENREEANNKLMNELAEQATGFINGLINDKAFKMAQNNQFKQLIRSMHKRGIIPAAKELELLKKSEDYTLKLIKLEEKLGKVAVGFDNAGKDAYLKAISEASSANNEVNKAHRSFYDSLMESDAPEALGDLVAGLGGPLTQIGWKLGYLAAVAGPIYGEKFVADRDIANLKASIAEMDEQLQRIELDLNMNQRPYNKYCKEKPQEVKEVQVTPPPPPIAEKPAAQSKASAGASGAGTVLGIIAVGAGGVYLYNYLNKKYCGSWKCTSSQCASVMGGWSGSKEFDSMEACKSYFQNTTYGSSCHEC